MAPATVMGMDTARATSLRLVTTLDTSTFPVTIATALDRERLWLWWRLRQQRLVATSARWLMSSARGWVKGPSIVVRPCWRR